MWEFGHSNAIMPTELIFSFENQEVKTTGTNTVYVNGTKKGNLRKSIESGVYQFLNNYYNNNLVRNPSNIF